MLPCFESCFSFSSSCCSCCSCSLNNSFERASDFVYTDDVYYHKLNMLRRRPGSLLNFQYFQYGVNVAFATSVVIVHVQFFDLDRLFQQIEVVHNSVQFVVAAYFCAETSLTFSALIFWKFCQCVCVSSRFSCCK